MKKLDFQSIFLNYIIEKDIKTMFNKGSIKLIISLYKIVDENKRDVIISGLSFCDISEEDVEEILKYNLIDMILFTWKLTKDNLKRKFIVGFQKSKLSQDNVEKISDYCGIETTIKLLKSEYLITIKSCLKILKLIDCIILYNIGKPTNNPDCDNIILSLDILNCKRLCLSSIIFSFRYMYDYI